MTRAEIVCPVLAFAASSVVCSITGMTVPEGISCATNHGLTNNNVKSKALSRNIGSLPYLRGRFIKLPL